MSLLTQATPSETPGIRSEKTEFLAFKQIPWRSIETAASPCGMNRVYCRYWSRAALYEVELALVDEEDRRNSTRKETQSHDGA